ncbi:MAG: acetoacetate decarboxylase family protein [Desulfomonilaceae bacterium]
MVKKAPAPWNLTGNGYVILYWFKKENLKDKCFLDDSLKESYMGGRGCVMLVDYKSSDVGPYKELLFIPGKINFNGKKLYTISKIFVSTLDSVVNGRENWGIPKEHANFSWMSDKNTEKIVIEHDGHEFFSTTMERIKFLFTFPLTTSLLPFPLVQIMNQRAYYTNFHGKGTGSFARIKQMNTDAKIFPGIDEYKPLVVIKVENFRLTFPLARTEDYVRMR